MTSTVSRAGQATSVADRPWADHGFFGSGPTWRVWTHPTALLGFQRAVVLEHLDPHLTAAVADAGGIYADPYGRLDRTLAYFLTVAVADGRTAVEASEILMRVHARAVGTDPVTGTRYHANNPVSQLWIHVTGWHSVLACYERYGPGPLPPADESRFWADCVVAAELQTCRPGDVPRSRDEVRAYFAEVRPRLCTSERALAGMHYLLRPPLARVGPTLWALSHAGAPAVVATLPRWMRRMGRFEQPGVVDSLVAPPARLAMRLGTADAIAGPILRRAAPQTAAIRARHRRDQRPHPARTTTPAAARALLHPGRGA